MRDGLRFDAEGKDAPGAGLVRFAGLVFDSGAAELSRESGEPIALTRGELSLLRTFLARPGRVLSRDTLLDAVSNRPLESFDRSVDMLVGRLRKKIEPDPAAPRVIVTVPGEGYRFDGFKAANNAPTGPTEPLAASVPDAGRGAPAQAPRPGARRGPVAAALAALALGAALLMAAMRFLPVGSADRVAAAPRLSVVVLPFENVGGDPQQDYFADALTEDLTSDLSHIDGSFVISRGTAFTYNGKPADPRQIGRDLGVRYVLEGSVRRTGERIAVNARLVSTDTGAQVWTDRFDGERARLGELQVEFVSRLANSLGWELVRAENLRALRERPDHPDAVDLVMRAGARGDSYARTRQTNGEKIDLYERALALDPQSEPAMLGLSFALNQRVNALWSDDPADDAARAERLADSALALRPNDTQAHMAKAAVFFAKRQWKAAISQAEAALADDPNNAAAHNAASFWKVFLGDSEDGFAGVEAALRLSPRDPDVSSWQFSMCHLHTHLAQWELAIEWCGKSIATGESSMFPYVDLAAAEAWAGYDKEARETVAQLRKLYPDFTVQSWAGIHWSDDPTFNAQYARIVEGLRKAGVPEGEAKP